MEAQVVSSLSNIDSLACHTLMSAHNHKRCQDSIFICETSLSLLLPINCNDDQSYVCQLSTTFMPHTLYIWSHYYPCYKHMKHIEIQIYDIQFIPPFTYRIYMKHMSKWQTTPKDMSEGHWVVK